PPSNPIREADMPSHPTFKPFNFQRWIDDNQHLLKPPVSNKQLFDTKTDMTVMIVGGPNQRVDFHDDPVEEFFYQLKGDMVLKIAENGKIYDVPLREGDVVLQREVKFLAVHGDLENHIAENGKIYDVPVREGEVFLIG